MSSNRRARLEIPASELAKLSDLNCITTSIWVSSRYENDHVPFSYLLYNEMWILGILRYLTDLCKKHISWFGDNTAEWFKTYYNDTMKASILDLFVFTGKSIFQKPDASFLDFIIHFLSTLNDEINCDERIGYHPTILVTHMPPPWYRIISS